MNNTSAYTVRNLKTFMTHDGGGLNATLHRGGVKVAQIEDGGTGGGIFPFFTSRAEGDLFNAYVLSLGMAHVAAGKGMDAFSYAHSQDSALSLLVTEAEALQEAAKLDRASKTKLVYRFAADGDAAYRQTLLPASVAGLGQVAVVRMYRVKAAWFSKVADVWIIGAGWTPISSI